MKETHLERLREQIEKEPFADHMGIRLREIAPGYAVVEARLSEKMNSIHGLTHGGAISALVDAAAGAAANSHGMVALALNMTITYIQPPETDALLVAEAKEESQSKHTATYHIEVLQKNENETRKIAVCQALAYIQGDLLPFLNHVNNEPFGGEGQEEK